MVHVWNAPQQTVRPATLQTQLNATPANPPSTLTPAVFVCPAHLNAKPASQVTDAKLAPLDTQLRKTPLPQPTVTNVSNVNPHA